MTTPTPRTDTAWCDAETEVAHIRLTSFFYVAGTPIKDDQQRISMIGKVKPQDYARVRGNLEELGWRSEGGFLRHKRIEQTLSEQAEHNEKIKANSMLGVQKRRELGQLPPQKEQAVEPLVEPLDKPLENTLTLTLTDTLKHTYTDPTKLIRYRRSPTKPIKLLAQQSALAELFESALDSEWRNDSGKWINRIKIAPAKCERVIAEVKNASKEKRIKTTTARYAEQIWKEFK